MILCNLVFKLLFMVHIHENQPLVMIDTYRFHASSGLVI